MWLCVAALLACGDDGSDGTAGMSGSGACLPALDLECSPTYPATFDNFYDQLIDDTCAISSCHGPAGNAGNLTFGDADAAYQRLLDDSVHEPLVIPGDPECSMLIKRLESEDRDFVMPARNRLPPGERCAIRQWVANGAER